MADGGAADNPFETIAGFVAPLNNVPPDMASLRVGWPAPHHFISPCHSTLQPLSEFFCCAVSCVVDVCGGCPNAHMPMDLVVTTIV